MNISRRELGWDVDTDELTSEPPDFELHDFTPDHREDLAELYNRENELITGTAVKPTYWHNKHPGQFQGWFWTNSKGKPVGYISGGAGIKFHLDLDYQVDLDRGEITDALRHQINAGFKGIRGPLSPYAVCAVQVEGNRWLIVDGKGTKRKQRRHLVVNAGDKLNVYLRERSLFWVDESVGDPEQRIHSIRGGQEIAQLIVGTETADEIVEMNQIRLSGKAQQLIEVLFPAQYPQMENQAL